MDRRTESGHDDPGILPGKKTSNKNSRSGRPVSHDQKKDIIGNDGRTYNGNNAKTIGRNDRKAGRNVRKTTGRNDRRAGRNVRKTIRGDDTEAGRILRQIRKKDRRAFAEHFLRHPADFFEKDISGVFCLSAGLLSGAVAVIFLSAAGKYVSAGRLSPAEAVSSVTDTADPLSVFVFIPFLCVFMIPYLYGSFRKRRRIEKAEEKVPALLRAVSDRIKGGRVSDLSEEMLFRREFTASSPIIRKAFFIAGTSEKAGGRIPDALKTAAADAEEEISARREKRSKMKPYAYVMIASYLIFLGIITFLVFSVFGSIGTGAGPSGILSSDFSSGFSSDLSSGFSETGFQEEESRSAGNILFAGNSLFSGKSLFSGNLFSGSVSGSSLTSLRIFHALVIQGFFCGLICGRMTEGLIPAGLLYSVFCVMCAWGLWMAAVLIRPERPERIKKGIPGEKPEMPQTLFSFSLQHILDGIIFDIETALGQIFQRPAADRDRRS